MRDLEALVVSATLAAGVAIVSGAAVAAGVVAVPPARVVPAAPAAAVVVTERLHTTDAPRRAIDLGAVTARDRAVLRARNLAQSARAGSTAKRGGARALPLSIGFARTVPAAAAVLDGATLDWVPLADGGFVARVDVASTDAAAIRLALVGSVTDPDVTVRFAGSAAGAQVFGPYPANAVAEATKRDGAFWSPVLEGSVATLEIQRPADVPAASLHFSLARVSHLLIAGSGLYRPATRLVADIGLAAPCEIDVACVVPQSQALKDIASATTKLVYTDAAGDTYSCSGTLVNDSIGSGTPYLFTANHCIDSATSAATLNTYWFFDATSCGSKAVPPYVLQAGGAMLLGRSDDWDWALVRLKQSPPVGAFLAAWRAEPVAIDAILTTIHHPQGDLKKWSQGTTPGYEFYDDGSSFITMRWSQGVTEAGSSGSGLFSFFGAGGYYELRGGLWAGESTCSQPKLTDAYSRLDAALPYLRQYLTPNVASPAGTVPVVEYYNGALGHFFITASPVEINNLDTGVLQGWERTGLRFLAFTDPTLAPANARPVCRYYMRPEAGNSHFYSADVNECAAVAAQFGAAWIHEAPNVFYIPLPDAATGACPAGTRPIWRFLNLFSTNHRYTAEVAVRDVLRLSPGWQAEGYGPDAVIMCSPEN